MRNSLINLFAAGMLMVGTPAIAQDTSRVVEYEYYTDSGLIRLERVEPISTHCVETLYTYDTYGNKETITVQPCAATTASFERRVTVNSFAVKATGSTATSYPAGAYMTATALRKADGTTVKQSTFDYDPRFGTTITQTEVALADGTRSLSKRAVFDDFGRVTQERAPVFRAADGTTSEMFVEHQRVYCRGAFAPTVLDAHCLNYNATPPASATTSIPSWMLSDAQGNQARTAAPLPLQAVTAYFVRSTPKGPDGAVVGARSVTHFDGLHRSFAKETETYDARWSVSMAAFNSLGLEGARWSPYFGRTAAGAFTNPPDELRQWTSAYDLLHRPVKQSQYWRGSNGAAATVIDAQLTYNGLEATSTVPSASSPDGVARSKKTIKNPMGKVAQTLDAYGATINMAYDASGNLVRTTDGMGAGNTTTIVYTATTARFKTSITDPDTGTTSFTYDALGQLKSQTDANTSQTTFEYDVLGRLIARKNPSLNGSWSYDKDFAGTPCAAGLNRLCEATAGRNAITVSNEKATYDNLGRPLQSTVTSDRAYVSAVTYDTLGRVDTSRYPTGLTIKNTYSSAAAGRIPGVLETVSDNASATRIFWSVAGLGSQAFDARGNLLRSNLAGASHGTSNIFDPISGKAFLLRAGTSAGGFTNAMDHRYTYDQLNNIASRNDALQAVADGFDYDKLERLARHNLTSGSDAGANRSVVVQYNAIGNILSKTDVGGYAYTSTRPHAITAAAGVTYGYDAKGQLITASGDETRAITWSGFGQVERLTYRGRTTDFTHDHSYKRISEVVSDGANGRRIAFVHPNNAGALAYEREETITNNVVTRDESRHYISVGGAVVAVVKTLNGASTVPTDATMTQYWHRDALGSTVAVSDASGAVLERTAFDPWGRRIQPTGRAAIGLNPAQGDRGFTGHEHLDEHGLIHMNGRIYNPLLGRFTSADSLVERPGDLQSYNRYA